MKRLLALILIACLALSVCACASGDATADPTTAPTSTPTDPSNPSEPTDPTEPSEPPKPELNDLEIEGVWARYDSDSYRTEYFLVAPNGVAYYYEGCGSMTCSWELNGNILRVFAVDTFFLDEIEYFSVDINVQDTATRVRALKDFDLNSIDLFGRWESENWGFEITTPENEEDDFLGWLKYGDDDSYPLDATGHAIMVYIKGEEFLLFIMGDCLFSNLGDVFYLTN